MNVLSLFAGIGGLDLGLERAGMQVVGQVEIDPFCQRVLAKHWPEVPRHDDVRTCIDWWRNGTARPAVHVVAGGFPCQPVSLAGHQRAQADERWIWPAAWAVIRDLRPQWAVLENVPGLLSRGIGDVLGDLAAIGYDAEWDCIPAAAVGAPHRRDRVFVVAYPSSQPGRLQPVPEPRGGGAAVAGDDGPNGPVADPQSIRRSSGRNMDPTDPSQRRTRPEPTRRDLDVADPDSPRRQPRSRLGWTRQTPVRNSWWAVEPGMGRMAHGIPGRVDRLKGLGNAVVPQIAEHIGQLLMAAAQ